MAVAEQTRLEITVNGRRHRVEAEPETPLLYVLRNELGLVAAKFGCGLGRCGTCNVLVDGETITSCNYPVSNAAGKQITTLEGLGTADSPHSLQQAFLDEQAAQCGYCIPGIIIAAAGLLNQHPAPDETAIRQALAGNLCRCGAHVRIIRAVARAASCQLSVVNRDESF